MTRAVVVRTLRSALWPRALPLRIALVLTLLVAGPLTSSARAVPHWARQYGVACGMCHLVPPKLNEAGEEFFANGYRLPGLNPIPGGTLPLSALIQVRDENKISSDVHRLHLREVELIAGGPLGDDGATYFVEWLPFNQSLRSDGSFRNRSGRFEDVVVTLPVGDNGSLAVGQFRAGSQVDVSRRLSISEPLAFDARAGSFSVSSRSPGVGFSYFCPDEPDDAVNGWTHGFVVPFPGELAINDDFSLNSEPEGVFVESYKRAGLSSVGGYLFLGQGQTLAGAIGVLNRGKLSSTLNVGLASADDDVRLSVESEYLSSKHLATGARFERHGGSTDRTAGVLYVDFDTPTTTYTTRWRLEWRAETGRNELMLQLDGVF